MLGFVVVDFRRRRGGEDGRGAVGEDVDALVAGVRGKVQVGDSYAVQGAWDRVGEDEERGQAGYLGESA